LQNIFVKEKNMFYDKVKSLCDKKGISVTELTKRLHLGGSISAGWKNGAVPRPSTVKAVADFCGVDVAYFDDGCNIANNSSNFVQGNQNTVTFGNGEKVTRPLTEIENELLRLCEKMTIQQKNELLTVAYKLVEKEI
jgi:transcriptional regulator with XRE-family HTH domain